MKNQPQGESGTKAAATSGGAQAARILAIAGVNVLLVLLVVVFTSAERGQLPNLNAQTLAIGLLPVSAALGLLVACRRLDLALPAVLALALAIQTNGRVFPEDSTIRLAVLCGICGGIGLVSALVTWFGRISSALWTGLLALALLLIARQMGGGHAAPAGWPWPAALGASLGVLLVGAILLGALGLVSMPNLPPILRTGLEGSFGLTGAWVLAGISLALASQSEIARQPLADFLPSADRLAEHPLPAYPPLLAAAALGGAYILRGRWGAPVAVVLTCAGHLAWSFAWSANLGNPVLDFAIPAAAPLIAVPLYLAIDWSLRHGTNESGPTGLLA